MNIKCRLIKAELSSLQSVSQDSSEITLI